MPKVSIYAKNPPNNGISSLFAVIYFQKKQVRVYLDRTIQLKYWDTKKQRSTNDPYLNDFIDDMSVEFLRIHRKYQKSGSTDIDRFRKEMKSIVNKESYVSILSYISTPLLVKYDQEVEFVDYDFFKSKHRIERYNQYLSDKPKTNRIHELLQVLSLLNKYNVPHDSLYFDYVIKSIKSTQ